MYLEKIINPVDGHECFPIWTCQVPTMTRINSYDIKKRKKALRESSSSFIKRKDVREYIFIEKGEKCYLCGNVATQIDHKIPVAAFAYDRKKDIKILNSYNNLFPICKHCNVSKKTLI